MPVNKISVEKGKKGREKERKREKKKLSEIPSQ